MFNSPISKGKRTGYKRYKSRPFGKKSSDVRGGACLFCGYFTSNDLLMERDEDTRINSLKRLNKNCRELWVCKPHRDPLLELRWADLLLEITS